MVHSSTAEEISPIDSRLAVHEEAIAEIEAIATNTGNTVEQHEHLINVIENKVDRFGLELKRTNLDVDALGESVDNMPVYDENNRKRTFLALSRDKMASTIENLTAKVDALTTKVDVLDAKVDTLDTKVDALAAKDASREQQLAAWTTAFDERLARLEFQHKFAETSQMLGRMDF
ncbi:Ff.00g109590.m01.CDS01 [Fusarium sp. VM40]|nr:Ff.00g109590.m01.CDS01 [Fusarium sp. VM40]